MTFISKYIIYMVCGDKRYCDQLKKVFYKKYPNYHFEFFLDGKILMTRLDEGNRELPHLILLDLLFPEMDGSTTLLELKQDARFRRIPIIMLNISSFSTNSKSNSQVDASAHIKKPAQGDDINYLANSLCIEIYKHHTQEWEFSLGMINNCIDFIPINKPYTNTNWSMLYAYGQYLNDGVYISVN